jgi:hypothetical protein
MKTSSAKAKGRRAQQEIRDLILETFSELEEDDVRSTSMGASGVDIQTSPKCQENFPFACEVKNQEKISIWESLKQATSNSTKKLLPILFFKRNRTPSYTVLKTDDFFKIIKIVNYLATGVNKKSLSYYLLHIEEIENDNIQDNKFD